MVSKDKDTSFYHFHNANPKGKNASDCVYRAISVALDQDYATTMRELTEFAIKLGYAPNENKTIKAYMESKGWITMKEPRDHNNKKISVQKFLRMVNPAEVIVVKVGSHHISLIKEERIWDTWDCSKKTMHTYWRKDYE